MSEKKDLYDYTAADYLDPKSCGSSLRCSMNVYKQSGKVYAEAFAELKDCTRVIEWSGRGSGGLLAIEKKLTVAIRMLTEMRRAVRDGGRVYLKNKPKRKPRKKNAPH